jgi:hypothetical protein
MNLSAFDVPHWAVFKTLEKYSIVVGVSCSAPARVLLAPSDYFDDGDYVVVLFLYFSIILFAFSARRAAGPVSWSRLI